MLGQALCGHHQAKTQPALGHQHSLQEQRLGGISAHPEAAWMGSTRASPVPPTLLPTSAVMRAMRLGRMAPHSTFLRRLGFLGSFRLLILLRTRLRYFMSVLFSSWKICGVCQGIKGARRGNASPVGTRCCSGLGGGDCHQGQCPHARGGGRSPQGFAPGGTTCWGVSPSLGSVG